MFTASKHFPAATTHRTVIQGIAFQLDECLKRYKICQHTLQFSLFCEYDYLNVIRHEYLGLRVHLALFQFYLVLWLKM